MQADLAEGVIIIKCFRQNNADRPGLRAYLLLNIKATNADSARVPQRQSKWFPFTRDPFKATLYF